MSREIKKDFDDLKQFVVEYSLGELSNNLDFLSVVSKQHKKYFAYLTCLSEIVDITERKTLKDELLEKAQVSYLLESCSDVGSALFVMFHGSYKASRMMLRSSIETFLKGFQLDENNEITKEKNMFSFFEEVKVSTFFSNEPNKGLFRVLHNHYKVLCQDTHTAGQINMQHITALQYFPSFSKQKAESVSTIFNSLVQTYITLIAIKFNVYYHAMHHRNKENVLENIPKIYRKAIAGLD